jgi:hypothetical protein
LREEKLRRDWALVAGEAVARHSRPGDLRRGVLTVAVDSSAWLCELTLRSEELLAALRSRYDDSVTSLRFALGAKPTPPTSVTRARPSPVERLSAEDEQSVEALLSSVADPALAASIRRLVRKDLIAQRRRSAPASAGKEDS